MFQTSEELAKAIAAAAGTKKAQDIVLMRMSEVTLTTDYFVVCSGNTSTQTRAIADAIEEELLKEGIEFNTRRVTAKASGCFWITVMWSRMFSPATAVNITHWSSFGVTRS